MQISDLNQQLDTVSGQAFSLSHMRRTNGNTRGGTNTLVFIYGAAAESNGSDITYVNSSTSGDNFLINTTGVYSISASFSTSTSDGLGYINVGSGTIVNITQNTSLVRALIVPTSTAGTTRTTGSWTGLISAGQNVWINSSSTTIAAENNHNQVTITRMR